MTDTGALRREENTSAGSSGESQRKNDGVIEGRLGHKRAPAFGYDWPLLIATLLLISFGLIMLYSASSYISLSDYGYSYFYARKQLFVSLFGLLVMVFVSALPLKFWKAISIPAFILGLFLIFLVTTSLGVESNGAKRWLDIGGVSVQPAEVLKLATIMMLAFVVSKLEKWLDDWRIFFPVFILGLVPAGLVAVVTDDLGTAIIFFGILFVMLFVACKKYRYLVISAVVLIAAAVYFIASEPYRLLRIKAWLNIEDYADTTGYQIMQGLYAIGSGGIFGKGLGKSTQKLSFVPEAENDMIFSIICEELGLIGVIILCLLYGVILWRMKKVFDRTLDTYARLAVAGVAAHISIQAIVNMCVVTNLLPNTGVPLPFVSYGGTSTLILLAEIGLVMAASRSSYKSGKKT